MPEHLRRLPPSALDHFDRILQGPPLLLLDFDGVLSPIVPRPDEAHVPEETRLLLARLRGLCPVVIITGRDADDVRPRLGVDGIRIVGNHGLETDGTAPPARLARALDDVEAGLRAGARGIPGALVERKRFSVALHYRTAPPGAHAALLAAGEAAAADHPELRVTHGKCVVELRPADAGDKGTAVATLVQAHGPHRRAIYIGDDETDEDGFAAVRDAGTGILVADEPRDTAAGYTLTDVHEVGRFLTLVAERCARRFL